MTCPIIATTAKRNKNMTSMTHYYFFSEDSLACITGDLWWAANAWIWALKFCAAVVVTLCWTATLVEQVGTDFATVWCEVFGTDCVAAIRIDCCLKRAKTSSVWSVLPPDKPFTPLLEVAAIPANRGRTDAAEATLALSCSIPEGRDNFWWTIACAVDRGWTPSVDGAVVTVCCCCCKVLCLSNSSCWEVKPLVILRVLSVIIKSSR